MSEELLMQETQPEVEAETKETVTQDAGETEATETETTPTEAEGNQEQSAEQEEGGDNAETEQENTDVSADETAPPVIKVKYNKQEREYSLDDAIPLVQKGLLYDNLVKRWGLSDSPTPTFERLRYLASTTGQTVPELIESLVASNEEALYQQILEKVGGNEEVAKELHEAKKAERQRKYEELKAQEAEREKQDEEAKRQAENDRIANEFIELKQETGKFSEFSEVPKEVLRLAAQKHISLLDAYLRYERSESKKAEAQAAKQAENEKSSTGSLNDSPTDSNASMAAEIRKGIWGE